MLVNTDALKPVTPEILVNSETRSEVTLKPDDQLSTDPEYFQFKTSDGKLTFASTPPAAPVELPGKKQLRAQVKKACICCRAACKKCDDFRPCSRCVRIGKPDDCVDAVKKLRVRGIKRGPYKNKNDQQQVEKESKEKPPAKEKKQRKSKIQKQKAEAAAAKDQSAEIDKLFEQDLDDEDDEMEEIYAHDNGDVLLNMLSHELNEPINTPAAAVITSPRTDNVVEDPALDQYIEELISAVSPTRK